MRTILYRSAEEADEGSTIYEVQPEPDSPTYTHPPFEVLHERALFEGFYDHVLKAGWNVKGLYSNFGSVWTAYEGHFKNPNYGQSTTEYHVAMKRPGGLEKRVFSAICRNDVDYVETAITTDKHTWYGTDNEPYMSHGHTGFDLGSNVSVRKADNNQDWLFQQTSGPNPVSWGLIKLNIANQIQIGTGQKPVLIDGTLNRGEVALALPQSGPLVVPCSLADLFRTSQMTDDLVIDLQGLQLGSEGGRLFLRQSALGGKRITEILCSDTGRQIVMNAHTCNINCPAFLAPGALAVLRWEPTNAGGLPYVLVSFEAAVPIVY